MGFLTETPFFRRNTAKCGALRFWSAPFFFESGEFEKETVGVVIKHAKEKAKARKASGVYARLLAAGQRLMTVIRHNEGGANKDLAKFADQINSMCDKWDR